MANARHGNSRRRRPHPQPMGTPFLEFDLAGELEQLAREPQPIGGQNAKTLVKYDDLRIVLIALRANGATSGFEQSSGRSIYRPEVCSPSTGACLTTLRPLKTAHCCSPSHGPAET
jgi:hypothetical protein